MERATGALRAAAILSAFLATSACVSIAALEPVSNPPARYQADVAVRVEFLHPAKVGPRCAERGVTAFGLPAPNAMACANRNLITMPNPCDTVTAGWYAAALCAEIAHSRGWEPAAPLNGAVFLLAASSQADAFGRDFKPDAAFQADTALRVEFVDVSKVGLRCAERGATIFGEPTLNALSCSSSVLATAPNPCAVTDGGWYAGLLCHEMGHVNGWPQAHTGGGFSKAGQGRLPRDASEDDAGSTLRYIAAVKAAWANLRQGDSVRATMIFSLAPDARAIAKLQRASGAPQHPSPESAKARPLRSAQSHALRSLTP